MKGFKYRTTSAGRIVEIKTNEELPGDITLRSFQGGTNNVVGVRRNGKEKYIQRSVIDETAFSLGPKAVNGKAEPKKRPSSRARGPQKAGARSVSAKGQSLSTEELLEVHTTTQHAASLTMPKLVKAIKGEEQTVVIAVEEIRVIHAALQSTADLTRRKLTDVAE